MINATAAVDAVTSMAPWQYLGLGFMFGLVFMIVVGWTKLRQIFENRDGDLSSTRFESFMVVFTICCIALGRGALVPMDGWWFGLAVALQSVRDLNINDIVNYTRAMRGAGGGDGQS